MAGLVLPTDEEIGGAELARRIATIEQDDNFQKKLEWAILQGLETDRPALYAKRFK